MEILFDKVLDTMFHKSCLKQAIFRNTIEVFSRIKKQAELTHDRLKTEVTTKDPFVTISFKESSAFECELRFSGDMLVFNMHTNVFLFDKTHPISKTKYIKENPDRAFCGVIHIYNFLSDSYKYNRLNDLGYLICRIFVNQDNHFYVEGRKPFNLLYNNLATQILSDEQIQHIIEHCILNSLNFDLLVPPIEQLQVITVAQKLTENGNEGIVTGKRVGFKTW